MYPTLIKALEYARTHGTTMSQTANAVGISPNALANYVTIARRKGEVVEFPKAPRKMPVKPAPRAAADPSDVPLDLIRHVRNGHPYWEKRPVPMGAVGRGPSPPVPPAPSDAAERHHTAAGIAWRLDVAPGEAERLRGLLGLPVCMTDGEADAIIRIIRGAAPSRRPDPPAQR